MNISVNTSVNEINNDKHKIVLLTNVVHSEYDYDPEYKRNLDKKELLRKRVILVNEELNTFEFEARELFLSEIYINNKINFEYLNELDELDYQSERSINSMTNIIIQKLANKYKYISSITKLLDNIELLFNTALYCGLNLPMLDMREYQVERVIDNAFKKYNDIIYKKLKIEMLIINHRIITIQRYWRLRVSDPYHIIGINHIHRDFEKLLY